MEMDFNIQKILLMTTLHYSDQQIGAPIALFLIFLFESLLRLDRLVKSKSKITNMHSVSLIQIST